MAQTRSHEPFEQLAREAAHAPVLIAYATRGGSTRGIAERIARQLEERGRAVEVTAAGDVANLSRFDAVVLGSGIYDGRWLPEATALAERNRGSLANRPLWLFSVGSLPDRRLGSALRRAPRGLAQLRDQIRPRGVRTFAGVIDPTQPPWRGRTLARLLGCRAGDNRDWAAVDAWGEEIATSLRAR